MIPYYLPNFKLNDLFVSLITRKPTLILEEHFRKIADKEYILFTSSCRAALYLAYKVLPKQGVVHTSPLTCIVAINPILASGNRVRFHDVKKNDWTLDPSSVPESITKDSIAIQAIHLGGFPCDVSELRKIADDNKMFLIEDCAQGYGSTSMGESVGRYGDIACFTLTKNVFGIGGGVFATNNKELYQRAVEIHGSFPICKHHLTIFRVVIALISSFRGFKLADILYKRIKETLKTQHRNDQLIDANSFIKNELYKPSRIFLSSVASRLDKIERLNTKRVMIADQLISSYSKMGFIAQKQEATKSSYTKLFILHPKPQAQEIIKQLNHFGIEAMHLEHKHDVFYQQKLTELIPNCITTGDMKVYDQIHDRLISLPLYETMSSRTMLSIIDKVKSP